MAETNWFTARDNFVNLLQKASASSNAASAAAVLKSGIPSETLDPIAQDALKTAFRVELERIVKIVSKSGIAAVRDVRVTRVLDLTFDAARAGWVPPQLPLLCLDDLFEAQDAGECKEAFAYVETIIDKLKKEYLAKEELRYIFVKTCNTLMKRLSKCNDLHLCSRILIFLAHSLPLSEKSGVNKKGLFNVENVTDFAQEDENDAPSDMTDGDEQPAKEKTSPAKKAVVETEDAELHVSFDFYQQFWSLQQHLHDPQSCLTDASVFDKMLGGINQIILTFQSYAFSDTDEAAHLRSLSNKEFFFTKFLTSPQLIGLQLKDVFFRRHICVQILVAIQYLRDTNAPGRPASANLSSSQLEKLVKCEVKVWGLLAKIPPGGAAFMANVKQLLNREEHWVAWKRDGCPPFERTSDTPVTFTTQGFDRMRAPAISDSFPNTKIRYCNTTELRADSSSHLIELANVPPAPTMESHVEEVRREMAQGDALPAEMRRSADMIFVWKTLRLISTRRIELFARVKKEHNLLEQIVAEMGAPEAGNGTLDSGAGGGGAKNQDGEAPATTPAAGKKRRQADAAGGGGGGDGSAKKEARNAGEDAVMSPVVVVAAAAPPPAKKEEEKEEGEA